MTPELIEHNFNYHKPDSAKVKRHEWVREEIKFLALGVNSRIPECREKSLAITKLEEAMFWANAAIARQKENSNV